MAKVELLGRELDIPRYKIGALRKAAPHIDAINKMGLQKILEGINTDSTEMPSIELLMEPLPHMLAVIAIGASKLDPQLTAEYLEDEIGFDEMGAVATLFRLIVSESGLMPSDAKGEAPAPTAPEQPVGASESSSDTSSET